VWEEFKALLYHPFLQARFTEEKEVLWGRKAIWSGPWVADKILEFILQIHG